jgi:hypothetical protein
MKLTKTKLKQLIQEEFESIAGQDVPNESKYPEIMDAFRDVLDAHLGVDTYNLYRELSNIAEYSAKRESPGV